MSTPDAFGLVGQTLEGQYHIDRVVGEGGFSIVYRGRHLGLDEPIAIKCLKLDAKLGSAVIESFVRRFRDEGRILYRLSQGNLHIVRCIASGTAVAPGNNSLVPFTILEWLEGCSLAEDLEGRRQVGHRGRSVGEAIELLDTAVDAVAYAHMQGVVHRDLNPGNIFLTRTREGPKAKVLDFGIAKIVSDHALSLGPRMATLGNIRIFSPAYAAPEQLDTSLGGIGPWTDVYTLSLVFLELLLDRNVVEGDSVSEMIAQTLRRDPRPTPKNLGLELGNEMQALFARSLALAPNERPRDAGDFWGALKNAHGKMKTRELSATPSQAPTRTLPMKALQGAVAESVKTVVDELPRDLGLPTKTRRMSRNELPVPAAENPGDVGGILARTEPEAFDDFEMETRGTTRKGQTLRVVLWFGVGVVLALVIVGAALFTGR